MKKITLDMIYDLRKQFDEYTKTAEQYEFLDLMILDVGMQRTISKITDKNFKFYEPNYIENNQEELNTMFRVVLKAIGKDYSEYLAETKPNEARRI